MCLYNELGNHWFDTHAHFQFEFKMKCRNIKSFNIQNEIYEFVKNFISDPGSETKSNNWTGYKNLSIGELLIFYGKTKIANETIEYLEITSPEMLDFTVGERVMNATG